MIHQCVIEHHKQCTLESRVFFCKGFGLFHLSSCLRFPSILIINFLSFLRIPLLKPSNSRSQTWVGLTPTI
ncbi:hypothetical protein NC652_021750 [Populus alba x Populus x berolinensis]|nr:hypothetical protein NC652_021750 [Populus alba x Populus x berolinensis]